MPINPWLNRLEHYTFAFFGPIGATGMQSGLALMVLAVFAQFGQFRRFWRSGPLAWPSLALVAYVGVRVICLGYSGDGLADAKQLRDAFVDNLALSGLMTMIVAWWLARPGSSAGWVLVLAAAGFLLNVARYMDAEAIRGYMEGNRAVFGRGSNGPGLFAATVLIGLVSLALP